MFCLKFVCWEVWGSEETCMEENTLLLVTRQYWQRTYLMFTSPWAQNPTFHHPTLGTEPSWTECWESFFMILFMHFIYLTHQLLIFLLVSGTLHSELSWKHHRCQFPDLNSCQDPCKDLRKTNTAVNQNSKHQEGAEDIFKWKKSASIWNYTQGISKTF